MVRIFKNFKSSYMFYNFIKKFLFISLLLTVAACSGDSFFSKKEPLPIGERISILGTQNKLTIDLELKKLPVHIPSATSVDIWDHTVNSRVQNIKSNLLFKNNKTIKISSTAEFATTTSPIITDNLLIAMGTKGEIIAYEYKNDKEIWENNYFSDQKNSSFFSGTFLNGGLSYYDNIIYATAGLNKIIAIDAKDGNVIWATGISSPTRSIVSKKYDKLFVQAIDNKLFCLSADNGKVVWNQYSTAEDMYFLNISSVAIHNNIVIIQYPSGEVTAVNALTGDELWSTTISRDSESSELSSYTQAKYMIPIIENDIVYINSKDGVVTALSFSTGKIIWDKILNISKQFWLSGDYIYAITNDDNLLAIHKADGKIRWVTNLKTIYKIENQENPQWSEPIMLNSQIITVSSDGKILFFNPYDGILSSEVTIKKAVYQRPAIINDKLFLTSDDSVVTIYSTNR